MKSTSSINILSAKSILSEKQIDSRQDTRNNHILISQLHYCRFIYYLARNIGCLLLCENSRNKLTFVLFKHLQKLIRLLADDRSNWFNLKNWDNFKESKKYYSTHLTMKEYSARYEKEYLVFIKKVDANLVRDASKELNDLTVQGSFTNSMYRKMMGIISPILREVNHNTTVGVSECGDVLSAELKGSIEGTFQLFKYYKLL